VGVEKQAGVPVLVVIEVQEERTDSHLESIHPNTNYTHYSLTPGTLGIGELFQPSPRKVEMLLRVFYKYIMVK
jgi:hypothetical protein